MSLALSSSDSTQHDTAMAYNSPVVPNLPLQQQLDNEKDRFVRCINNRAAVLVLSKGDYSEANKLFDTALMIHKQETEDRTTWNNSFAVETATSLPSVHPQQMSSSSCSLEDDEDFDEEDDMMCMGDMDCQEMDDNEYVQAVLSQQQQQAASPTLPSHHQPHEKLSHPIECPTTHNSHSIPRMTSSSRLQTVSYCGQHQYHQESSNNNAALHNHEVYSLPIVMDEQEWATAPTQDKSFVLIFNTAVCNHLWGMQLMQEYSTANNVSEEAAASMAQHCRETLTVSKLLYKLALENSVSFCNGVDKMCYVALYNNLSHVCKTLEGYESVEAHWCDDMLLKAIFWWRDSNANRNNNNSSNNTQHPSNDLYLDNDVEIIDSFLDNVFYRVSLPEDTAPAAAA